MKKYLFIFLMSALMIPVSTKAEDFLGAPIIPGGKIIDIDTGALTTRSWHITGRH